MRAVMDWLIELFNRSPSLEQRLQLFSAYENASLRLSHLLRTQHLLAKDGRSEIDLALDQALEEVAKEMGLH